MLTNLEQINPRLPKNIGFFSWQGNNLNFEQSRWLFYLIFAFVLLAILLIILFRRQLYEIYENTQTVMGIKKKWFWMITGIIALLFLMMREFVMIFNGYPHKWEIIPIHYCRLFLVLIILSMIFNKINYIKCMCFFTTIGALIAFFVTDLNSTEIWRKLSENNSDLRWGLDSYVFWDFLLTHSFVLLMPILVSAITKPFSFLEYVYSTIWMFTTAVFIFIIDYLTTFAADKEWWANWFYFGIDSVNTVKSVMGPLSHWPYALFTYTIGIIVVNIIILFVYFFFSKIYLQKTKRFYKLVFKKSYAYIFFKNSIPKKVQK